MSISELFDQVDIQSKANLTWEHGELIATIEYYNQKVLLYLVKDFYVEIYYHPIVNEIVNIEKSTHQSLTKFLNTINYPNDPDSK